MSFVKFLIFAIEYCSVTSQIVMIWNDNKNIWFKKKDNLFNKL